jgi:uncharacterized peroxidase-related enzyme
VTTELDPRSGAAASRSAAGAPAGAAPTTAACAPDTGGWIATVDPADATGILHDAYERQRSRLGRVTGITRLGSLYPELVAERLHLYEVIEATPSAIPDWAKRAVILTVSALNGCHFCMASNTEKLVAAGHGHDAEAIAANPLGASTGDKAIDTLLAYARKLTRDPAGVSASEVASLRAAGWTDLDILDVNNLVAYYAYINRVTAGLGLNGVG